MFGSVVTSLPLGLGTGNLRSLQGGISARAARSLLEEAFSLGIDFIDTAPSYGQGQAEESIGGLPDSIRTKATICSKVGFSYGRKSGWFGTIKPLLQPAIRIFPPLRRLAGASRNQVRSMGGLKVDLRPETIRESLEGSLRRLRRERLDILLLHDPSESSLRDDNVAVLEQLRSSGTIGGWGVSTKSVEVARAALRIGPLQWLQMPGDPPFLAHGSDVFTAARAAGKRVIANRVLSPLLDRNAPGPRPDVAECFRRALALPAVERILFGTANRKHLADNIAAMRRIATETGSTT
jgi:aryl-alcohol dehydrogenase-like predicted oxidoreductase